MSIAIRRCLVSGLVQGVGYRVFVRNAAKREHVSGYVRNLIDGRVETVLSGTISSVERVQKVLQVGPTGARIDEFESMEHNEETLSDGFEIRVTGH